MIPTRETPTDILPAQLVRIGVLPPEEREFFGDEEYAQLYDTALHRAASLGWAVHEFDYRPFRDAADLLYQGPWVAERYSAAKSIVETNPSAIHPVVRSIMLAARKFSAVDAFEAQYRLAELARESEKTWQSVDALLLPSAGTIYTVEQIFATPIELNSNLGRYTNFMNLLDLCGIAIPAGFRSDRIPFGVTLFAKAWADPLLFELAGEFENGGQARRAQITQLLDEHRLRQINVVAEPRPRRRRLLADEDIGGCYSFEADHSITSGSRSPETRNHQRASRIRGRNAPKPKLFRECPRCVRSEAGRGQTRYQNRVWSHRGVRSHKLRHKRRRGASFQEQGWSRFYNRRLA